MKIPENMSQLETTPYKLDNILTNYMPLPRDIIAIEDLSPRAKLTYALLMDRATLSQKNGYANTDGDVYVIYTREHLAEDLNVSVKMVGTYLAELEAAKLIKRKKVARNGPNHIYVMLPLGSIKVPAQGTKLPAARAAASAWRGKKLPSNDLKKQQNKPNYYQQPGEDESL